MFKFLKRKKEIKQNWVNKFQNEFTPLIDFGTRNEVIEFIDNLLEQREKEILEERFKCPRCGKASIMHEQYH